MIKPIASPNQNRVDGIRLPKFELTPLVDTNLGGGMNTSISANNIDDSEFTLLKNARTAYDCIVRRPGSTLYIPLKPNNTRVLAFIAFNRNNGQVLLLRFNPAGIHSSSAGIWNAATGTALTGGNNDRFTAAIINDRFMFTNNGVDYVQEYNPSTNAWARLGNADKYKFVTGFGKRTVVANLQGSSQNPIQVGWSGINNYGEFNPLTDSTAGSQPLVDSTSNRADYITGAFGGSQAIEIFRERSIWEGTNTNSPTQPFNFYAKVKGIGSDSPYTIKETPLGFTFVDTRTRSVYVYGSDGSINPIDGKIKESLFSGNIDPNSLFAGYNQKYQQYQIALPDTASMVVKVWTFSFIDKTWTYDEYSLLTSLDVLDYSSSTLAYNDLVGSYNDLIGTYNDLINNNQVVTKFLGFSTGELSYEDFSADTDAGASFSTEAWSKEWEYADDLNFSKLSFNYKFIKNGNFALYYSKDAGVTWKLAKTFTPTSIGAEDLKLMKKLIKARRFKYKLVSTSGLFKVSKFNSWISKAGDPRK